MYKSGMAHLSKFMDDRKLSDEDVAGATGLSRVTISRIRRRIVRPDWSTIKKLKELSGGVVTADDFEADPVKGKERAI
jgi:transcriptional regulator with XRE-family HTH domain